MEKFFDPQSVVLIGVSRQTGPGAYNNLEVMLRYGYQGRIYLVHPKVPEICGHRTYARIAELPEAPELAVISVGRDRVPSVFAECIEKGIRHVIIISQGFADADERGRELQSELAEAARKHRVRVLGPNTMGILNPFSNFSTAFVDIERDPDPPALTLVAQSGVFQVGYESFTGRLGKAIDVGNACDVDFTDVLAFLENDHQTRIIVLHMEGMTRGREFLETASRVALRKPVIVLKTGRSTAGALAALSHTGSLVGEDAIFDAAFARAGIIRVRNMIELHAVARAFLSFQAMRGPRLGVVTATGACGIMTADACEDYGMELAPFPEEIRDALENSRIGWHRLHNPVDIWPLGMVSGSFTDVFKSAARGLLQDNRVDAVLGIAPAMASPLHVDLDMPAAMREIQAFNSRHKPIALWLYGGDQIQRCKAMTGTLNVACFATIDEAVMGLAAFWRYRELVSKAKGGEVFPKSFTSTGPKPMTLPRNALLVGETAFEVLRHYQIPLVPGAIVDNAQSAVATARESGYPVVLKIISPQWLHKSDRGGIRLDIGTEFELKQAFEELLALFESETPDGRLDGVLIQKQVNGTELLMGIKKDPQFGPVLVVGMGGIYTEVFRDVARSLLPVRREDAEAMLRSLRMYPILRGIRGRKGANEGAVVDAMLALSRLALDYPEIVELDLNPVVADSDGCWCVDCRIVTE